MFSIRDVIKLPGPLSNPRGQGIIEYVLVLVVTVSLILGGLYSLNSAFKAYANNYFGNYLACLLESGELPNIQGGGGDGGICNQIFKPFSLAEGRPLKTSYTAPTGTASGKGGGSRESGKAGYAAGGGSGGGGGGGGYAGGGGSFSGSSFGKGGKKAGARRGGRAAGSNYTGSMAASDYGSGAGGSGHKINVGVKNRLDNRFAFDDEREKPQKRSVAGVGKHMVEERSTMPRVRVKRTDVIKKEQASADSGLSLPNLLKYLIIAGILIALFVFLGGQGLQIGKSME